MKFKRFTSFLLVLAMVLCLLPTFVPTSSAATGYDRGYTGGRAGWGKIYAHGIDVSEHQGTGFDFWNLKNNGYSYVILRCGFVSRKDYRFEEYYTNAKAAGLDVGVYFYSYASSAADASYEADRCLSYISGKTFEYPVYFDFEDSSSSGGGGSTAYNICMTFMDKIANAGYLTGLYGYAGWLDEDYGGWVPTASICQKYECWLANYYDYEGYGTYGTKYSTRYGMYQYQSDKRVGSYGGNLDANICYKDYPSIVKTYGFNGYSASGGTNGPVSGVYTIKSSVDQNYVLDVCGKSLESGANIWVYERLHIDSQRFAIEAIGDGYYTIRAVQSKKYVDVAYGGSENDTNIWQCDYIADSDAQKWKITDNGDGTYSFFAKCNGKALDMHGGEAGNGVNVSIYESNGSGAQKWVLEMQPTMYEGVYKLGAANDTNYVLNVAGNSHDNEANVWVWERANDNGDQWAIQACDDGYYTLRETGSNKYLDAANGGTTDGTNVQLYEGNFSDAQKWSAIQNTDGSWSFYNKASGKALDLDNGVGANGTNVHLWTANYGNTQKWIPETQKTVNAGVYQILSNTDNTAALNVAGDSVESGSNVHIWWNARKDSYKVVVEYVGDGSYTLRMLHSDKYLDAEGPTTVPGANVGQHDYNGNANQLWRILPNEDGSYTFTSRYSNHCLDRCNGSNENGTNIIVWKPNRGDPQKWNLVPTTIGLDGVWTIAASGDNNYVLDIDQASSDAGANLMINEKNGGDNQKFIIQNVLDSQYYTIRALHSMRVLNVNDWGTANGTNVIQYSNSDTTSKNELWQIIPHADGSYSFVSAYSGLYLDLSGNALANGTNVQTWSYDSTTTAQKWNLTERHESIREGVYQITTLLDENFAVDVDYSNEETVMADGANVQICTVNGGEQQKFALKYADNGYYKIVCVKSGKNLDVQDWSLQPGANVQQYTDNNGGDSQLWSVLPNYDGSYTFVAKCGGYTMDILDGVAEFGKNVQVWNGNTTNAQKWRLNPTDHTHVGEEISVYPATCMGNGYTEYRCTLCGEIYTGNTVPALGHDFSVMPDVNDADHYLAPTCNEEGLAYHKCSRCDAYDEEGTVLAATGHNMVAGTVHPATCTEDGYTEYHCTNCDATDMGDIVAATGHNMVAGTVHPATCTADGYTEYHCANCDATDMGDIVEALGHNMVAGTVHPATCTEDGYTEYHCTNCDATDMGNLVEALGHNMVAGTVHPATCTEDGYTEYHCTNCDLTDMGDIVEAKGHNMVAGTVHPATCTEDGYTEYHCTNCDLTDMGDIVEAKGHNMVAGTVHPATCTDAGYTEYYCTNCDLNDIDDIKEALGHNFVNGVCTGCGKKENQEAYAAALTLKSANVDLNSDISINFNGLASIFNQYEDVYVVYSAAGKEDVIVRDSFTSSSGSDLRYNYAYNGLTALDLELEVSATVYGTKDGVLYHGDTKSYSIYKYCNSRLNNATATAAQKTVCANLLNYGGAAQLFKGVPADQCVNAKMTEEQKAYASDMSSLVLEKKSVVSQGTQIRFASQSLDMDSRITMNFVLSLANYTGDRNSVTYEITYTDSNGVAQTRTYTTADLKDNGNDRYTLSFAELRSTEMRTLVTCTVYINGVKEASYTNSVENYCFTCVNNANNPARQKTLAKYLMLYGDSAAVTFGS